MKCIIIIIIIIMYNMVFHGNEMGAPMFERLVIERLLSSSSSSSSAYPGSGRGGSSSSRGPQTSLSRATLTSSDGGIPRRSQASVEI